MNSGKQNGEKNSSKNFKKFKKSALKNFPKFTGKPRCWSLLFNIVADLGLQFYLKRDCDTVISL